MLSKHNISAAIRPMLLLWVASFALFACSKPVIDPVDSEDKQEIRFGSVSTRADIFSGDEEFSVWTAVSSDEYLINDEALSYYPWMKNERVYNDGERWTYDNTSYWLSNSMFYFFAAYPYDLPVETTRESQNDVMYTVYSLDVTADGSDDTEDILVASAVSDTGDDDFDAEDPVELNFNHLLTKINLTVSQNFDIDPDFNYYVTAVTLTGVAGAGTYMVLPYGSNIITAWTNTTDVEIVKTFAEPVILRNPGAADPKIELKIWGQNGLMLIPQTVTNGGVQVRVDYLYDVDLDDEDKGTPKFVEGFIPATEWQSNKSVTYSLSIANTSNIIFSKPSIEPWGAPQTGGTMIIK